MGRAKINEKLRKEVFNSLKTISDNPNDIQKRFDYKGRIIAYHSYGKRDHKYGWNIDHINRNTRDNSKGNLRAVHFKTHEKLNLRFNKSTKL